MVSIPDTDYMKTYPSVALILVELGHVGLHIVTDPRHAFSCAITLESIFWNSGMEALTSDIGSGL